MLPLQLYTQLGQRTARACELACAHSSAPPAHLQHGGSCSMPPQPLSQVSKSMFHSFLKLRKAHRICCLLSMLNCQLPCALDGVAAKDQLLRCCHISWRLQAALQG